MHVIEVGSERPKPLSILARRERQIARTNKQRFFVMRWVVEEREHTELTQWW